MALTTKELSKLKELTDKATQGQLKTVQTELESLSLKSTEEALRGCGFEGAFKGNNTRLSLNNITVTQIGSGADKYLDVGSSQLDFTCEFLTKEDVELIIAMHKLYSRDDVGV